MIYFSIFINQSKTLTRLNDDWTSPLPAICAYWVKGTSHLLPGHILHRSVAWTVWGEEHCKIWIWLVGLYRFCIIYISCQAFVIKLVLVITILTLIGLGECFILPIQKIILKKRNPVDFAFRELVKPRTIQTEKPATSREVSNPFPRNGRQVYGTLILRGKQDATLKLFPSWNMEFIAMFCK